MYFIDYTIIVVPFFLPFITLCLVPHLPPSFPHLSSCPWVIHTSSLASPFPILFLTSIYCVPTIYASYSCSFSAILPLLLLSENPPCDLYFCESVAVLVVCLAHFCFWVFCFLGLAVDGCDFVVILLFVFLIFFFFLDKSL